MANTDDNEQNVPATGKALLDAVAKDMNKSAREGVKGKLKALVQKKAEHQKSIAQLDKEISNLLEDYEAGLL